MQVIPTNFESSMTSKGQVTIPVYLRGLMNLTPGDKVIFDYDDDYIKLKPSSKLDSVYGSIKPFKKGLTYKQMRTIALEEKLNAIR